MLGRARLDTIKLKGGSSYLYVGLIFNQHQSRNRKSCQHSSWQMWADQRRAATVQTTERAAHWHRNNMHRGGVTFDLI